MYLNPEAFARFRAAYHAGLAAAVAAEPDEYDYTPEQAPTVAERMLRSIIQNPIMVNYGGGGFRRACGTLGIKHTKKAIFAFLKGESVGAS